MQSMLVSLINYINVIDIFMGLSRMLNDVHVNGQDRAALVVQINESKSKLVDVTYLPL